MNIFLSIVETYFLEILDSDDNFLEDVVHNSTELLEARRKVVHVVPHEFSERRIVWLFILTMAVTDGHE